MGECFRSKNKPIGNNELNIRRPVSGEIESESQEIVPAGIFSNLAERCKCLKCHRIVYFFLSPISININNIKQSLIIINLNLNTLVNFNLLKILGLGFFHHTTATQWRTHLTHYGRIISRITVCIGQ